MLVKSKSMHPTVLPADILPGKSSVRSPGKASDGLIQETEGPINNNVAYYQQRIAELSQELAATREKYTFICQVCLEQKDVKHLGSINSCVNHHFCCQCLVSWGLHQNKCPSCKQRYTMLAPALGVQPDNWQNREACLTEQFNFYERDICPATKQQLTCKKT